MVLARVLETLPSFSIKISPVLGSITSSATTASTNLFARPNFLLYLYLPTLARSYLLGSKNREFKSDLALSTVGGSPGLSLLYISLSPLS